MIRPRLRALVAVSLATLGLAATGATAATAATPSFAPAASAAIHPGASTNTAGGQCTANFVFTDASGGIYLGQAAHCSGTGAATSTNGCTATSRPLGTKVSIEGATAPGTMVYNSWLLMQARGETNPDACAYNDLALVALDPADHGRVNPTVPFWGGPTGIATAVARGTRVFSYGNSSLRAGIDPLKPKTGLSLGQSGGGWNHTVLTVTPGVPGDSGSAFLDAQGRAFGVLSTLQFAPLAGSNGVGDLSRELAYANEHGGLGVQLALGTEPFSSSPLAGATPLRRLRLAP